MGKKYKNKTTINENTKYKNKIQNTTIKTKQKWTKIQNITINNKNENTKYNNKQE